MRAVIQRVSQATVYRVGERSEGQAAEQSSVVRLGTIGQGIVVLLGVARNDSDETAERMAERCCRLRIFDDSKGKMNRSLLDIQGSALVVSQFTLLAETRRGLRPSFDRAADPSNARRLYDRFISALRAQGVPTQTGEFGAHMNVRLENDGPVTILLDSES
ncbi:MAG: D-aminoacyl-tRNA deacylase [candidate division WOR-3 bacterium]